MKRHFIGAMAAALIAATLVLLITAMGNDDLALGIVFGVIALVSAFSVAIVIGVPLMLLDYFVKFSLLGGLTIYVLSSFCGVLLIFFTIFDYETVETLVIMPGFWSFYATISALSATAAWYFAVYDGHKDRHT